MSDSRTVLLLNSKVYDVLKTVVQIVLPASAVLYTALATLWGFPYVTEVVGTTAAITTFLGVILGRSSKNYKNSEARFDGSLEVSEQDTSQIHRIEITTEPENLQTQEAVTFRVRKVPNEL